MTILFTRAMLC